MEIASTCSQLLEDKGMYKFSQPDKTPLGLLAMFDHWQEHCVEQFYPEYR
jgi:hypothetical protein